MPSPRPPTHRNPRLSDVRGLVAVCRSTHALSRARKQQPAVQAAAAATAALGRPAGSASLEQLQAALLGQPALAVHQVRPASRHVFAVGVFGWLRVIDVTTWNGSCTDVYLVRSGSVIESAICIAQP
jgi:hypothetical protein